MRFSELAVCAVFAASGFGLLVSCANNGAPSSQPTGEAQPAAGTNGGSTVAPLSGANSVSAIAAAVASGAINQASGQDLGQHRFITPFERIKMLFSFETSALAATDCPTCTAGGGSATLVATNGASTTFDLVHCF